MNVEFKRIELSPYKGIIAEKNVFYCEIIYKRDRSSFAGVAFRIQNEKIGIYFKEFKESVFKNIDEYEKIYVGLDEDYCKAFCEKINIADKLYGMEVYFLVYSDLRSSQIAFEKLAEWISKNIDKMINI